MPASLPPSRNLLFLSCAEGGLTVIRESELGAALSRRWGFRTKTGEPLAAHWLRSSRRGSCCHKQCVLSSRGSRYCRTDSVLEERSTWAEFTCLGFWLVNSDELPSTTRNRRLGGVVISRRSMVTLFGTALEGMNSQVTKRAGLLYSEGPTCRKLDITYDTNALRSDGSAQWPGSNSKSLKVQLLETSLEPCLVCRS